MTIRLVLAGGESLLWNGVRSLLGTVGDLDVVAEARDGQDALRSVARLRPDVVVVDSGLPGIDGISLAAALDGADGTGAPRVVVLADRAGDWEVSRAVDAGVSGFVTAANGTTALVTAVRSVAGGGAWLSPPAARVLVDQHRSRREATETAVAGSDATAQLLSERERTVVRLVARGGSNAEIAEALFLGQSTIKTHVSRILAKLELRDRAQLTAFAYRNDLT